MTIPFETVLVANRGEIAVRIIATLRALGIRSVAVYSDADDGAPHVLQADVAVRLGPARASKSYLDVAAIIAAARSTGAEAIHPGYGFLSESPALARACAEAQITFIGPRVAALAAMGDKIRAKELARAAGVPVIDGVAEHPADTGHGAPVDGADPGERDRALAEVAASLGFPVLIKPSAGGGGKGMVRAEDAAALPEAIASARRVAAAAFGDDTLLVERFLPAPRHIEVQVLADVHGRMVALGERDCSLQRRHQKVIEEAPATLLDGPTRTRLAEAACAVAASVDYRGAGTVEFLVSAEDPEQFAFLEMNTRLQVEHPVTEAVLGVDLVAWQVRLAAGDRLDLDPGQLHPAGHAVEARIYAERPDAGFLPATGTVHQVRWPVGVRVDAGIDAGSVVSTHYDPMLAKVIATGADRAEALHRLDGALAETVLLGVDTNIGYLRQVLATEDVRAGTADTTFLDTFGATTTATGATAATGTATGATAATGPAAAPRPLPEEAVIAAGLLRHAARWRGGLWAQPSGWRIGAPEPPVYRFETATGGVGVAISGAPEAATAQVLPAAPTRDAAVGVADSDLATPAAPTAAEYPLRQVSLTLRPGSAVEQLLRIDGTTVRVHSTLTEEDLWLHTPARTHHLAIAQPVASTTRAARADAQVRSPMPGTVVAVHVLENDLVAAEDLLVTVEAMKMEYQVRAGSAGRIHLAASVGDQVAAEQVLAHIDPDDPQDHPG
ncbi:acetyl/propionyl/methylcrotonyl-CoA carboxylase subunit alpha [Ruania zhangjianzhongii]|uniref:acetyl/propionyl/methylcrotonyl-CoA carboxylase subunit alpha n=1 Tax=Ruania zhangjianzhongii TaxID=2603206 RepID=UPI0016529158|nr:biotin carboxylase N-terminal domain-containing protein [Ruania zhangjianzhongii]